MSIFEASSGRFSTGLNTLGQKYWLTVLGEESMTTFVKGAPSWMAFNNTIPPIDKPSR
jgi:hypothetical protein